MPEKFSDALERFVRCVGKEMIAELDLSDSDIKFLAAAAESVAKK